MGKRGKHSISKKSLPLFDAIQLDYPPDGMSEQVKECSSTKGAEIDAPAMLPNQLNIFIRADNSTIQIGNGTNTVAQTAPKQEQKTVWERVVKWVDFLWCKIQPIIHAIWLSFRYMQ